MSSPYHAEVDMYAPVQRWLDRFLRARFRDAQIHTFDAHAVNLSRLIENHALSDGLAPDWATWEIQVDVVGFIRQAAGTDLAFVECKNTALSLAHLAQLLGYARIARPNYAFLISPQGPRNTLSQLLHTYNRLDILEYTQQRGEFSRALIIARWDARANDIAAESIMTTDIQKVKLGRF
jgi:hypothetical protein